MADIYSHMVIHNTFEDFILFIYIHMSHADNSYDPAELSAIKAKMSSLFPEEKNMEQKLYAAIRQYNDFDKTKLREVFEGSFKHFSKYDKERLTKVIQDLSEIIKADGIIDQDEERMFRAFRQLIDFSGEPGTSDSGYQAI